MWSELKPTTRILVLIMSIFLLFLLSYFLIPDIRTSINETVTNVQHADDISRYSTKKTVEDTARSMITSYTADALVYEQYKGSASAEKQSWAEQAKMRANKTAASYNEYILKNSFVWEDNVPKDIDERLGFIE